MKFTSKDLADAMGLKPGDKVKLTNGYIGKVTDNYILDFYSWKATILYLINIEYQVIESYKEV